MTDPIERLKALQARYKAQGKIIEAQTIYNAIRILQRSK